MNTGQFAKGNQAAAKPSKKAVAASIRRRLERDGDSLSAAQFTALTNQFARLTAKRRRPRKDPGAEKVNMCFADRLTGEEAEIHKAVLQIEAEQRETRRKEREASQKEGNGDTA
jgi:hypothetical protein